MFEKKGDPHRLMQDARSADIMLTAWFNAEAHGKYKAKLAGAEAALSMCSADIGLSV